MHGLRIGRAGREGLGGTSEDNREPRQVVVTGHSPNGMETPKVPHLRDIQSRYRE